MSERKWAWFLPMMVLTSLIAMAGPAHSDSIINVDTTADELPTSGPNGQCSLREAIAAANNDSTVDTCVGTGDDTINLLTGSTYTLPNGVLDITEAVTINGNGTPLPFEGVSVQAFYSGHRIFTISGSNFTVNLNDFTIAGASCNPGSCDGAGVYIPSSTVTVNFENMSLGNNFAGGGSGGGIYNAGTVNLSTSNVSGNAAHASSAGGGIYNSGTLTMTGSKMTNNPTTGSGGAIYNNGGAVSIVDSIINQHVASGSGAGIYNNNGNVTLVNSTMNGNIALGDGGGIFTTGNGAAVSTFYSTIYANRADYQGSGDPGDGGGIAQSGTGTVALLGTILAGNLDESGTAPFAPDCSGTIGSNDRNLIGAADTCTFDDQPNDIVGTLAVPVDPLLNYLGNYGGPTMTNLPLPSSPAVNNGHGTTCPGPLISTLTTDQRGLSRPQNGTCDIGAAELETVPPTVPTMKKPKIKWQPDRDVEIEWTEATDPVAPPGGSITYEPLGRMANFKEQDFQPVPLQGVGTTQTISTEFIPAGRTACFRVQSRDIDGNASAESGEKCTAVPVNDPNFKRRGKWAAKEDVDAYLGDYLQTKRRGAKLLLKKIVDVKRMALIATKCPDCGSVKVFMAGDLVKRVSLQSASVKENQVIRLRAYPGSQSGTCTIAVTTRGKLVKIEGLGISKV